MVMLNLGLNLASFLTSAFPSGFVSGFFLNISKNAMDRDPFRKWNSVYRIVWIVYRNSREFSTGLLLLGRENGIMWLEILGGAL